MGTALIYLLVVVVVAAAFFGVAALVFGRGEELPPLPPDATPTQLPARAVGADHVRALRFPLALRGYRMTEVDWVLDRLAGELERAEAERDELAARIAELESTGPAGPGTTGPAGPGSGPAAPGPAGSEPAPDPVAPEPVAPGSARPPDPDPGPTGPPGPDPVRRVPARGEAGSARIGE